LFDKHRLFLNKLNEVANACKHSFINTDHNHVGVNEPLLFALALSRNDSARTAVFHVVSLRELVENFSQFYVWQWQLSVLGRQIPNSGKSRRKHKRKPEASRVRQNQMNWPAFDDDFRLH
jgi:hypothetical protein